MFKCGFWSREGGCATREQGGRGTLTPPTHFDCTDLCSKSHFENHPCASFYFESYCAHVPVNSQRFVCPITGKIDQVPHQGPIQQTDCESGSTSGFATRAIPATNTAQQKKTVRAKVYTRLERSIEAFEDATLMPPNYVKRLGVFDGSQDRKMQYSSCM